MQIAVCVCMFPKFTVPVRPESHEVPVDLHEQNVSRHRFVKRYKVFDCSHWASVS